MKQISSERRMLGLRLCKTSVHNHSFSIWWNWYTQGKGLYGKAVQEGRELNNDSCIDLWYVSPGADYIHIFFFTVTGECYYCMARYITHRWEVVPAIGQSMLLLMKLWVIWQSGWALGISVRLSGSGLTSGGCVGEWRYALYPYPEPGRRERRSAPSGSFDNRVYIDSIEVPRGLPDELWIGIKHLLVITAATRLMGCQDRIALDMLLAEKGGVLSQK